MIDKDRDKEKRSMTRETEAHAPVVLVGPPAVLVELAAVHRAALLREVLLVQPAVDATVGHASVLRAAPAVRDGAARRARVAVQQPPARLSQTWNPARLG